MADFGSIAILVKLIGGTDVIKELQEIRKYGKELESKPIQIRVNAGSESIDASRKKAIEYTAWWERQTSKQEREDIRREVRAMNESNKMWAHKTKVAQQTIKQIEDEAKAQEALTQKQLASQQRAEQVKARFSIAGQREFQQWLNGQKKAADDYAAFWENAIKRREQAQARISSFQQSQQYTAQQSAAIKSGNLGAMGTVGSAAYLQGLNNIFGSAAAAQQEATLDRLRRMETIFGTTSNVLNRFSGTWDKAMQGIARFSDGLTHAGQVAATFAYRLTLITAPIDLLIAKSLSFSIELEYSLAKVATQLDGTLDKIREYASEAKGLTLGLQSKYGVDARDISSALYYQVSSGIDPEVAKASLEPLTKLSAAGQTSPEIASQALTAALNVFREELSTIPDLAQRSAYALEVLWAATKKGRFEFSDFATQFGRSAGQAEAAGLSFSQTAAMLASLSQVFTPSQSSTSLNSFMKAFIDQTPEAVKAFDELGIKIYETLDGVEKRRDGWTVFLETMTALQGKFAVSAREGDRLASSIFGDVRGGRAAQFFLDPKAIENLKANEYTIRNSTGGIARDWELASEQIKVAINQTIGMFYEFGNSVTKYLEPTIRGSLSGVQAILNGLIGNKQAAQMLAQVGAALAVAAPAALVFATALMGAGGLLTAIATLMTPAYLIGFSLIAQALAPALTKAASAVNAFGGGINGILATVTETARQLGLISDKDAFGILEKLGVEVDTAAYNNVKDFVSELRKLGDDAAVIGNSIKNFAEGVGLLIKNIGEGKGLLGFFAGIVKDVAGLGLGSLNLSGSGGIATALDAVIGGMIVAKLGSMFAGALRFITTQVMNVTAGAVNVAGMNSLVPTPFIGPDKKPVGGFGGGIGSTVKNAGVGLVVSVATATAQSGARNILDEIWGDDGLVPSLIKAGSATILSLPTSPLFALSLANGASSLINAIVDAGLGAVNNQFGTTFGKSNFGFGNAIDTFRNLIFGPPKETQKVESGRNNAISDDPPELRLAKDNLYFSRATAILDKEGFDLAATFHAAGSAATSLANAAVSAAGKLASIAGMTVGQGYFASPIVSADPNARYRALDARYQNLYPNQMKAAELVFADKMKVADDNRAAAEKTKAALEKLADAAKEAANKLADAIKGLVSAALGATSVTEKEQERMDLQKEQAKLLARLNNDNLGRQQQKITESRLNEITVRLEQLGPYKDQPDEFARRTRAVATGTDPATYGQEYLDQLALAKSKMPNASLEDIAAAFGDKSLFAQMTPDEIDKMWNWDAVVDSVRRGINRIVGEWKLMKQAVGEVMSQLSSDEISALKEALGLGANTSLDSLASKFLGKTTGLGAEGAAVGGALDPETVATFGGFADILERIKDTSNIVVRVAFDEKMWKTAQESILEAEKFIIEKLLNYADVFIQITARFSEDTGGNNGGNNGGGGGGTGTSGARATGGYVSDGIYRVGEQGYEYVIPHPIVKWMESILGGKINSPNDFKWLFESILTGGKGEAINRAETWAAGINGWGVEMPKNFAKWVDRIKVIVDDKRMSLDDALWQAGQPASGGSSRGGGGGGAASGGGTGNADISALKDSFGDLITALNHLTRSIDALSRTGFQTPQQIADFGGGGNGRNTGGESKSETIIFNGDILAPNQATVKTLYDSIMNQTRRNVNVRANHGMA